MNRYFFLGLATVLIGAGNAAKAFAESATEPAEVTGASTNGAEAEAEPKRRGRPAGSTNKPAEAAAPAGISDADRYENNRKLIQPLVEGGQGEEVKKVIGKYSKTGLKDLPADKQADFEKDLQALAY